MRPALSKTQRQEWNALRKTIGTNMQRYRHQRRLSLAHCARKMAISPDILDDYELGKRSYCTCCASPMRWKHRLRNYWKTGIKIQKLGGNALPGTWPGALKRVTGGRLHPPLPHGGRPCLATIPGQESIPRSRFRSLFRSSGQQSRRATSSPFSENQRSLRGNMALLTRCPCHSAFLPLFLYGA